MEVSKGVMYGCLLCRCGIRVRLPRCLLREGIPACYAVMEGLTVEHSKTAAAYSSSSVAPPSMNNSHWLQDSHNSA